MISITFQASLGEIKSVLPILVMVLSDFHSEYFIGNDPPVDSVQGQLPLLIYRSKA